MAFQDIEHQHGGWASESTDELRSFRIALTYQPLQSSLPKVLPRLQQLQLLKALARESGWRHLSLQNLLSVLSSLLDIA